MWLMNSQETDGSWMDLALTTDRDTAETVYVLKNFSVAGQQYTAGLQWLGSDDPENSESLALFIQCFF
jgi:hypothetical protein